jgi:cytochrome P450
LDPVAAKSLSQYQLPFGTGQRTCLGINLAYAETVAVLSELSRNYTFVVEQRTEWKDFPIKSPTNNLPMRLTRKAAAQGTA